MVARATSKAAAKAETGSEELDAPKLSPETLKTIEDLEAELSLLEGPARAPLRRKIRRLRRGSGVSITRVRSGRTRTTKGASLRILGESPADSKKRLETALRAAGARPSRIADGYAMPVYFPVEVLLEKFKSRKGFDPVRYEFIAGTPFLVVLA